MQKKPFQVFFKGKGDPFPLVPILIPWIKPTFGFYGKAKSYFKKQTKELQVGYNPAFFFFGKIICRIEISISRFIGPLLFYIKCRSKLSFHKTDFSLEFFKINKLFKENPKVIKRTTGGWSCLTGLNLTDLSLKVMEWDNWIEGHGREYCHA